MINVNTCNVSSGKRGARNTPHGPMTSYTVYHHPNSTPADTLLLELEQKCRKFGIYKMLEGSLTILLGTVFFVFLESMRKDMKNMARDHDQFWHLSTGEQRVYISSLLLYSLLCCSSGLNSLLGVVKKNQLYLKLCFLIQVGSVLFSTLLLIPTLYFVGPVFKGLLSFFALVYFPYNIYLTYIVKHYLDKLAEAKEEAASPSKLYECPGV